jgi:hypothetical protein
MVRLVSSLKRHLLEPEAKAVMEIHHWKSWGTPIGKGQLKGAGEGGWGRTVCER